MTYTVHASVHHRCAKRRLGDRLYGRGPRFAKKRPWTGRPSFEAPCARCRPPSQKPTFELGTSALRQRCTDGVAARCRHRSMLTTATTTKQTPVPPYSWRLRRILSIAAAGLWIRMPVKMPMPAPRPAGTPSRGPGPCNHARSRPPNLPAGLHARPSRPAGAVSTTRRPDGACGSGRWDEA